MGIFIYRVGQNKLMDVLWGLFDPIKRPSVYFDPPCILGDKIVGVRNEFTHQKVTFTEVTFKAGDVRPKQLWQFDQEGGVVSEFDVSFWNMYIYSYCFSVVQLLGVVIVCMR
jgi:hypothetical protein